MENTNEINSKITELHNFGYNTHEIAKVIKRSYTATQCRIKALKLPFMRDIKTSLLRDKIRELTLLGLSDKDIGNLVNKSNNCIQYHRKKMNIPASMPENNYHNNADRIKGYIIRNSKYMSKRRLIEFNLKYTDFELPEYCPILGMKLAFRSECDQNAPQHASLDRIDNSKGYIPGNVIVISKLANSMKNSANFDELILFCENMLTLVNFYKNQGALGSLIDVFPNLKLKEN